jgi:hypothetical protein
VPRPPQSLLGGGRILRASFNTNYFFGHIIIRNADCDCWERGRLARTGWVALDPSDDADGTDFIGSQRCLGPRGSRTEALPVFGGGYKRLDHLGALKVAVELIQLRQPEIIAAVI